MLEAGVFFVRKEGKTGNASTFFKKNEKVDLKKRKVEAYYVSQSSGRSSVVEHHVANVMVEGSNPFTRSIFPSSNYSFKCLAHKL